MVKARKPKIIVILGPTSSGKSGVAIRLAKKLDGEILSADSRQIYRGLDIGAGKEPGFYDKEKGAYFSEGIAHYGIDIVSPRTDFNAAKFKKYADKIITDILRRKKIPIICGGTGFWIKAIVDDVNYPEVKPDPVLRNLLSNKTAEELFAELEKLDPNRAKNIDQKNKVRLIRAIEICRAIGQVPDIKKQTDKYQFLQIGIDLPKEKLQDNIQKRLKKRFASGMISEVEKLHLKDKISWKRLRSFGLGYSIIPQYLKKEIASREELFEKVFQSEKDYAKRQMTWFRKDSRIQWLSDYQQIEKEAKQFLKK